MARTPIDAGSIVDLSGAQILAPVALSQDVTFDAGDDVNGNDVQLTGGEFLLVDTTDAGAQTINITAAPDSIGRTGAITAYALAAGIRAIFGPFPVAQWRQADGMLYVDVSDPAVELAILRQ